MTKPGGAGVERPLLAAEIRLVVAFHDEAELLEKWFIGDRAALPARQVFAAIDEEPAHSGSG